MNGKPVYIASDVHLGATPPEMEAAFLAWLASVPGAAAQLVLNGDLFDFWFEFPGGVPSGHERVLGLLREIVDSGVAVTLMGGNHDWWGGRYLREVVGVEFLRDPEARTLGGLRTYLAHGDGLGRGDLGYRFLRPVLRGRLTRFAFGLLGPRVGCWAARRVSKTHERWGGPTAEDRERAAALQRWAESFLLDHPEVELVALGHTHQPTLVEVAPGRWYLNTGDWVVHRSYAVLQEGRPPRLLTWEA